MQLMMGVLDAAAHAAQAWEAAVSVCCEPAAAVALGALLWSVAIEPSHATLVSCSEGLGASRDGAAALCSSGYACWMQVHTRLKRARQR